VRALLSLPRKPHATRHRWNHSRRTRGTRGHASFDRLVARSAHPLTGHAPEADYEALFTHIVGIVPAPIGLGTVASLPNNPSPFCRRNKELS